MIYEIFKSVVGVEWVAFEFYFALLLSAYLIYVGMWAVGFVAAVSLNFVFEGKRTFRNVMFRLFSRFGSVNLIESLPDGWYRTKDVKKGSIWDLVKVRGGEVVRSTDYCFSGSPKTSEILDVPNDLKSIFPHIPAEAAICLSPAALTLLLVLLDTVPIFAISVAMYFGGLFLARSGVRLAGRLEEHISDKTIHSGDKQ